MVRLGLSTALLAASAAQGVFAATAAPETIPGAYIIEYEDDIAVCLGLSARGSGTDTNTR
jgi:hypothetical protein